MRTGSSGRKKSGVSHRRSTVFGRARCSRYISPEGTLSEVYGSVTDCPTFVLPIPEWRIVHYAWRTVELQTTFITLALATGRTEICVATASRLLGDSPPNRGRGASRTQPRCHRFAIRQPDAQRSRWRCRLIVAARGGGSLRVLSRPFARCNLAGWAHYSARTIRNARA